MIKKILLVLLALLVIIQFIRPEKNHSSQPSANDITQQFTVPGPVQNILKRACYDCHSNNTNYPWYTNIQPVGWWMQDHITDGKKELNFSEFVTYTPKRQHHKLKEVVDEVQEGHMPISSYLLMHDEAELADKDKIVLAEWANNLRQEIAAKNDLSNGK